MMSVNRIKEICQQIGLAPTKRKGQNFLVNEKILNDIIKAADLKPEDIILEIGPGFGVLTEELAKKVKKVIAVELDKKLAAYLKEKFKNQPKIKIIQNDILKFKPRIFNLKSHKYKLVANLPYNITGIVLRKFLHPSEWNSDARIGTDQDADQRGFISVNQRGNQRESAFWPKPNLIVLMVQKEVAERILAKNKKSSIISLMVAYYGQPEIVRFVSKNYFWPRPKVDSAILRISRIGTNLPRIDTNLFFKFVRQGFSHPRKQLLGNLKKIKEKSTLEAIFNKIGLNLKIRAEELSLEKWLQIYYYLYEE